MQKPPIKEHEEERLQVLSRMNLLDTEPEDRFDTITKEAIEKFKCLMSTVSIIDEDREWYKSCQGCQVDERSRDVSFCGHAMYASGVFIVEDTLKDERFKDNPMVINPPFIRFYAGVALCDDESHLPIGVFCIKDTKPRQLSLNDVNLILELAKRAEHELNTSKDLSPEKGK